MGMPCLLILLSKLLMICMESLLICAVKEIIDVLGVGFDGLSRKIVTGDFSDGNLWLCFKLGYFLRIWNCLGKEEPLAFRSALNIFGR